MTLPVLHTGRLRLEPVGARHLPLLVALNGNPEVMLHLLGRAATPEETALEWEQRLLRQSDPMRGLGYWAGSEGGAFVGWWSASAFVGDDAQAGLGYRLRSDAWSRGLATEGASTMLEQAFAAPGVTRVVASTMAVNHGSRRVLEKVGLRHVGTGVRTWEDPLPGADQGEVTYELTRRAWLSGRPGRPT